MIGAESTTIAPAGARFEPGEAGPDGRGGIGRIVIDRPDDSANAIDPPLLAALSEAVSAARDARPRFPVTAALVAMAAWPWLLDVPTHVWSASLSPEIQQYYGTESGSITFTSLRNAPMIAAMGSAAVLMVVILAVRHGHDDRGTAPHPDDGGL